MTPATVRCPALVALPLAALAGCTLVFRDGVCPSDERWASVGAGGLHTCALHLDGTIACWGDDADGKLDAPAGSFAALSVGYEHACALDDAGATTCWGRDDLGQASPPAGSFASIAAGAGHTCALDAAGLATEGQVSPPATPFAAISAGWLHTCAVDPAGGIVCFGDDRFGQSTPPAVADATAISAGRGHGCAVAAGALSCWGTGDDGELELDGEPAAAVAAGTDTTCRLDPDGALSCVGLDDVGQATPPEGVFSALSIGPGSQHGCAVEELPEDGGTWMVCWGLDGDGQASPPREGG